MNVYLHIRSVTRTAMCVAASLAAAVSSGSAADRQQTQAQLLDRAEFLCANCFFGASDHYYCFAADNQILVAYQRTPVVNWRDKSKNYLTAVHPSWAAWTAPGQTVTIRYDRRHIRVARPKDGQAAGGFWAHLKGAAFWATRGDSQEVTLRRSGLRDIFTNSEACRNSRTAAGQ